MPEFKYIATNPDGVIFTETILAENEEEVRLVVKNRSLALINLQLIPDAKETLFDDLFHRVTGDDKAQFLEYFASMLEAGLTVSDALQAFYEDLDKPKLRKFIKDAQYMIRNGRKLSETFSAYPELFPKMYSGMIQVGEASGTLAQSLRHLADQLKKTNELKGKVKNAMIYPLVILSAVGAIMLIMILFVIPRISGFFADVGLELPILTRIMIAMSDALINYWYIVLLAIAGLIFTLKRLKTQPAYRSLVSRVALKLPIFGKLNKTTNVALMSRTFGSLLSSGVNILEAIDVVQESITNQVYVDILGVIKDDVSKGNNLSDSMQKFPEYFAPFEVRVISISEHTGEVAEGLKNVAEFYENKLYSLLTGLSSALEPILLVFMGGMVALVALSVITPIFQLLTNVQNV